MVRKMSDMAKRMITGLLLSALVIADIFWLRTYSVYLTDALVLFFAVFGSWEMAKALSLGPAEANPKDDYFNEGVKHARPIKWIPPLTALLSFGAFLWLGAAGLVITVLLMAMLALTLVTFYKKCKLLDLLGTLAAMIYPQMFLALFYVVNHDSDMGMFLLTMVLGISIVTDSMALGMGIAFGKHKLCPTVSPNKTIEGAIGGLLGGVIGSFIPFVLFTVLRLGENVANYGAMALSDNMTVSIILHVVLGLVGSVFNQVGDIAASMIKRKVGIKDYSKIFPGHGGVMDRMDGMSFVLVAVFIFNVIRCAL